MFTWLWNIRHRELIKETKAIIKLYLFLRHDCGLEYTDKLSARELKEVVQRLVK